MYEHGVSLSRERGGHRIWIVSVTIHKSQSSLNSLFVCFENQTIKCLIWLWISIQPHCMISHNNDEHFILYINFSFPIIINHTLFTVNFPSIAVAIYATDNHHHRNWFLDTYIPRIWTKFEWIVFVGFPLGHCNVHTLSCIVIVVMAVVAIVGNKRWCFPTVCEDEIQTKRLCNPTSISFSLGVCCYFLSFLSFPYVCISKSFAAVAALECVVRFQTFLVGQTQTDVRSM